MSSVISCTCAVKRRNKWICALKTSLSELEIWGPKGNPDAEAEPAMYTKVPWEEVQAKKREREEEDQDHLAMPEPVTEPRLPRTDFSFTDKNALIRKFTDHSVLLGPRATLILFFLVPSDNDDSRVYGETEQVSNLVLFLAQSAFLRGAYELCSRSCT